MCRRRYKEVVDKIGKIKGGKLIGFSDSTLFDLDKSLAIIIRDLLVRFKEINIGIPNDIYEKCNEDEELALEEWNGIIQSIIDKLDYYVTDPFDLLSAEDQEILIGQHRWSKSLKDKKDLDYILNNEISPEEKEVFNKEGEISKDQKEKLGEALDMLKERFTGLWL